MAKLSPVLASSANPAELSLMVKGALTLVVPIAGLVIRASGGQVGDDELQRIVEVIGDIIIAAGSVLAGIQLVAGALRKIFNSFKQ